jgi:hypothetical protein
VLSALTRSARSAGAEIVEGVRVSGLEDAEDGVRVLAGPLQYGCAAVVLCGGAWSGELAEMAGLPAGGVFRPSLQQVAYLQPRSEFPSGVPAFVERGPVTYYGVPARVLDRYKIGIHDPGQTVRPAEISLDDDARELMLLRGAAARLLLRQHAGRALRDRSRRTCGHRRRDVRAWLQVRAVVGRSARRSRRGSAADRATGELLPSAFPLMPEVAFPLMPEVAFPVMPVLAFSLMPVLAFSLMAATVLFRAAS